MSSGRAGYTLHMPLALVSVGDARLGHLILGTAGPSQRRWSPGAGWVGFLGIVGAFGVALLSGCAEPKVSLSAEPSLQTQSYASVHDRWTRFGRVGSKPDLDTPMVFEATLRSPEFQRAYTARYIHTYQVKDPTELARIDGESQAVTQSGLSFFVRVRSHNSLWGDLRASVGKWRVALLSDGSIETLADKIESAGRAELQQSALLTDDQDPFAKLWMVHFPAQRAEGQPVISPAAQKIILRMAGPLGQTDLIWDLK